MSLCKGIVYVKDNAVFVQQQDSIQRRVHESPDSGLALPQRHPGLPEIRDVDAYPDNELLPILIHVPALPDKDGPGLSGSIRIRLLADIVLSGQENLFIPLE